MEQRQRDTVYGYVRLNYDGLFMDDIINIIYTFYLIKIASNILNSEEKVSFIEFLFDQLKQQKKNGNIKSISTELLFRASENGNSCKRFHEFCDNQGPTITIINTEKDHIFGGYTSKSWSNDSTTVTDPNTFLFTIRPNLRYIGFKTEQDSKGCAIYGANGDGPTFGSGFDINIYDSQRYPSFNDNPDSDGMMVQIYSSAFSFSRNEMAPSLHSHCIDFEVFSVIVE